MLTVKSWGLLFTIALAVAACHARPPATSPARTMASASPAAVAPRPPAPPPPPPPPRPAATPAARPLTQDEQFQRKSLAELNTEQPLRDAFFDYDQNESRDDARLALQQDAKWLAKWPRTTISVDGMQSAAGTAPY